MFNSSNGGRHQQTAAVVSIFQGFRRKDYTITKRIILSDKLGHYSMRRNPYNWLKWSEHNNFALKMSGPQISTHGLPQGSVLGPLLFPVIHEWSAPKSWNSIHSLIIHPSFSLIITQRILNFIVNHELKNVLPQPGYQLKLINPISLLSQTRKKLIASLAPKLIIFPSKTM